MTNLQDIMGLFVKLLFLLWGKFKSNFIKHLQHQFIKDHGLPDSTTLFGIPIITKGNTCVLKVGENVVLCSDSNYTDLGVNHPVILRMRQENAVITIGDHTGISGATICADKYVSIGRECLIGANVIITDTDFHPIDKNNRRYCEDPIKIGSSPVVIGDNVFIGTNSIILKGVSVGENSVIGANSVVTKDIPCNVIAAGNPARVIKSIT